MIKQTLKSADFVQLKGLKNVHIDFSESLTAIMGVNGSGKTTVIHALACAFSPEENGYDYKFSYFSLQIQIHVGQGVISHCCLKLKRESK